MKLTDIEAREFRRYLDLYDFSGLIHGKTLLITGAKGIVGSGIVKWLLLENEWHGANMRIYASTRTPDRVPEYIESGDPITYCMFGEEAQLERIDCIIHAAAPTSKQVFVSQPVESLAVILDETRRMLELATKYRASMIYLSSEEAYGLPRAETAIDETYVGAVDSLNIRSCYPLGKKAAELLCVSYCAEYGTDVKIIRPTVIQGLLQRYESDKVENQILHCLSENRNLQMRSAGLTKKSMIYSLDAVSAVLTVLLKGERGEAYNATNPDTFMAVKELAATLFARFRPELRVEFATTDTAQSEGYLPQRALLEDIGKIEALGWRPITGLEKIYQVDMERFATDIVRRGN